MSVVAICFRRLSVNACNDAVFAVYISTTLVRVLSYEIILVLWATFLGTRWD